MNGDRGLAFYLVVYLGGLLFGLGLAISQMARPEVVLSFLQLTDFGLLFVMGGGAIVTGLAIGVGTRVNRTAPLTGAAYRKRLRSMDQDVLVGGVLFGVGWGLSGICPGAAYASVGIGNYPILVAIAGMLAGAYAKSILR